MVKKIFKSLIEIILVLLAIFIVAIIVTNVFFKGQFMFVPNKEMVHNPKALGITYEELSLKINNTDTVKAWHLQAKTEDNNKTILYFYGINSNMSKEMFRLYTYSSHWNFDVLTVDYPGYGLSEGSPSEKKVYQAANAAWDYLVNEKKVKPEDIIVIGHSLGGGIASHVAKEKKAPFLVLDSTFTKFAAVPQDYFPKISFLFPLIFGSSFNNVQNLKDFKGTVLFMHGKEDDVISFKIAEDLYQSFQGKKDFLELRGGHSEFEKNGIEEFMKMKEFFNLTMENDVTRGKDRLNDIKERDEAPNSEELKS